MTHVLAPPSCSVTSDNHVITSENSKSFGLVDTGHKGLQENTTAGRQEQASSTVIPTVHGSSSRGFRKVVMLSGLRRLISFGRWLLTFRWGMMEPSSVLNCFYTEDGNLLLLDFGKGVPDFTATHTKDSFVCLKSNRISEVSICGYNVLAYRWRKNRSILFTPISFLVHGYIVACASPPEE